MITISLKNKPTPLQTRVQFEVKSDDMWEKEALIQGAAVIQLNGGRHTMPFEFTEGQDLGWNGDWYVFSFDLAILGSTEICVVDAEDYNESYAVKEIYDGTL